MSYHNSVNAAKNMRYEEAVHSLAYPQVTKLHDAKYVEYIDACSRLLNKDYSVRDRFIEFGDYLCAPRMADECRYLSAVNLLEDANYSEALASFKVLYKEMPDYKDIAEKYTSAFALSVKSEAAKSNLAKVVSLFRLYKDCPGYNHVLEESTPEIYNVAVKDYRKNGTDAIDGFKLIPNYSNSQKYITLCSYLGFLPTDKQYNELLSILSFENAKEVIVRDNGSAIKFLRGTWRNNSGKYFKIENNAKNYCSYNLPYKDLANSTYTIKNGIYQLSNSTTKKDVFRIIVIDKNTISIYAYKDGSTHTLYRQ